jgi:hypothetical protein
LSGREVIPLGCTGWRWVRSKAFTIDKPGTHTVSLWMKQDGVAVDKLLITTDETLKAPARHRR